MDGNKWSIKKEITFGELITLVVVAFSVVGAYFSLDKRVTVLEDAQAKQAVLDKAQDMERMTMRTEFSAWLIRIEAKIDRFFEVGHGRTGSP
jgi:hypothetical protein